MGWVFAPHATPHHAATNCLEQCPALTANINKPLPIPPTPDSVLTAIDIRTVFKQPRSEKRKSPTIIVTDEKDSPVSQRFFSRPRTRSNPSEEQQLEKQKRAASRARARPVPELWPEPLSARSGSFVVCSSSFFLPRIQYLTSHG